MEIYLYKTKNFNYSNIEKLGIYDDYQIYVSKNWQCAEFKAICLNKPKKNYKIKEGIIDFDISDKVTSKVGKFYEEEHLIVS